MIAEPKKELRVAVVGRNLDDLLPMLRMFPCKIVEDEPELVISHGGDGSLLGSERRYPGVPKCPIRDRKQNPKCPRHSEISTLTKLFAGELRKYYLIKLQATTNSGESICGINEIFIDRSKETSAIRYRIWQDGELLKPQIIADSLIVATPFGSTGYFQSVTHGSFQCGLGLAFNNSLDLMGYTIARENSKITVELLRGPAVMSADNDPRMIPLETGTTLTIEPLQERTLLYGMDIFRCLDCYDLRKQGK